MHRIHCHNQPKSSAVGRCFLIGGLEREAAKGSTDCFSAWSAEKFLGTSFSTIIKDSSSISLHALTSCMLLLSTAVVAASDWGPRPRLEQ